MGGPALANQTRLGAPAIALNTLLVSSGLASLVYRYWQRSDAMQQEQLKWAMLGALVFLAAYLVVLPHRLLAPVIDHSPGDFLLRTASSAFLSLSLIAIPVALGIAIFRQGLFDIDRVISRTLAYAIVTGVLAGVYAGLVLLATQVLGVHAPVAVAAATLAAAALFAPVRRRVQRRVDRRFNRARYDAEQTVAAFAVRLKDAVDLDAGRGDLARVVQTALEPAHVSVWAPEDHRNEAPGEHRDD